MNTSWSRFSLAGLSVQRIDFDPHSLVPGDLLLLPHAAQLAAAVPKRQAEHLAGRMAASIALQEAGMENIIPGIGAHRQPLWPQGFTGSITHCQQSALAVAARQSARLCGVGLDCEKVLKDTTAQNIAEEIVAGVQEKELISASALPFTLALTLLFSAKESLFKALFPQVNDWFNFDAASAIMLCRNRLVLELNYRVGPFSKGSIFNVHSRLDDPYVITLVRY